MSTQRTSGGPSRFTVLRDLGTFAGGWALLFQQALFVDPARVNGIFVWAALALLGVPGASELVSRIGTAVRPSGSVPPGSPPGSPSPVTSSGGGE